MQQSTFVMRGKPLFREAEKLGFECIIIPRYNFKSVSRRKSKIEIHPVGKVEEALRILFG